MMALLCMLVGFGLGSLGAELFQFNRPPAASWKRTQCGGPTGTADIPSQWGKTIDASKPPLAEYPRPMMVRNTNPAQKFDKESLRQLRDTGGANWQSMNGLWQWEPAPMGTANPPFGKDLKNSILVPFPVESCLSGVAPDSSAEVIKQFWYRLTWKGSNTVLSAGESLLLHFGAVDWQTKVWINQKIVGDHTGGYDGFSFNITGFLNPSGTNELIVNVYDPSDTGFQPNGKQRITAIDKPGSDTYFPNSGIWQTVWQEVVPNEYIERLYIDGRPSRKSLTVVASVNHKSPTQCTFSVLDQGKEVAKGAGLGNAVVTIAIPSAKPWSPKSPFLYDLSVTCGTDKVMAYFGMREMYLKEYQQPDIPATGPQAGVDRVGGHDMPGSPFVLAKPDPLLCWAACNKTKQCGAWSYGIPNCDQFKVPNCWLKYTDAGTDKYKCRVSGDQRHAGSVVKNPYLNGEFVFFAGWLDQSYWPDGIYTAPSDDALKFDLTAVKLFGMNMARLHQKVNSERWYYHADTVGVAIMQDMPQKYGGANNETVPLFVADFKAMIAGRGNHPCIIQWEIFNEGDCVGVFKNVLNYTVEDMVDLARSLDWQDRLVNLDSGGPANDPLYNTGDVNDIHSYPYPKDPKPSGSVYSMVGEFGGMGFYEPGKEWVPGGCFSYMKQTSATEQATTYITMVDQLLGFKRDISASVYTQTTDLELECDGFLNYDRTNKFSDADTKRVADANQKLINTKRT